MKKVWVKAVPWDAAAVAAAIESGADAVVVEEGRTAEVRRLGRIQTVAPDGDLRIGEDVVEVEIGGKADEEAALRLSRAKTVVVRCADWTIIPLENLIAQTRGLFAEVKNLDEALTAVRILEKGVDGIVLHAADPAQIRETVREARRVGERVELVTARVTGVERCGTGDRVCVDTCAALRLGAGLLAGESGGALLLVHSQSAERASAGLYPFRIDAGGARACVLLPGGATKPLSEVAAHEEALVVAHDGSAQRAIIGRVRIEKGPLLRVKAEAGGRPVTLILDDAETSRLVTPGGAAVSVRGLEKGTEILAHLRPAAASGCAGGR